MGFLVQGFGFRVWGLGFEAWGLGLRASTLKSKTLFEPNMRALILRLGGRVPSRGLKGSMVGFYSSRGLNN